MELKVKQLRQTNNQQIIAPQTTAEAVLVKHGSQVKRLDVVLAQKIESVNSPAGSGIKVLQTTPTSVVLTHTNEIDASPTPKALRIGYDNRGHITSSAPLGKLSVVVDNKVHIEHDGSSDQVLQMGDDFTLDENNKIKLNWNNL